MSNTPEQQGGASNDEKGGKGSLNVQQPNSDTTNNNGQQQLINNRTNEAKAKGNEKEVAKGTPTPTQSTLKRMVSNGGTLGRSISQAGQKVASSIPKPGMLIRQNSVVSREAMIGKSGMLHEAAEHGNTALVNRYCRDGKVHDSKTIMLSSDYENRNALHKACFNGHVECVKILLEHSHVIRNHVDDKDRFGCTALYLACVKNTVVLDSGSQALPNEVVNITLEIVNKLLENGAKPNLAGTKQHGTALHWCAIHGFDGVVIALLSKGGEALVTKLDLSRDLPIDIVGNELFKLRYRYEEQMINIDTNQNMKRRTLTEDKTKFIDYTVLKTRQEKVSSSQLESVLARFERCCVALIAAVPLVKETNKKKSDATTKVFDRIVHNVRWLQSMLLWCCYLGLTKEVEAILEIGKTASVHLSLTWGGVSTQSGRTALHFAALMGHDAIIDKLNAFYKDPTQIAKFVKIEDMQKKTCCCGARDAKNMGFVNYPDHFANTPLHLCAMQAHFPNEFGAHPSTTEKLLGMGADATLLNAEGRAPASYARGEVRKIFEQMTEKQKNFEGTCFDSPRVKNEKILSFDWIIRFKNYKEGSKKDQDTMRSIDSKQHQLEMKKYLEGKRCLVRLIEDPKKDFFLLLFTATETACRFHAGEIGVELPVLHKRVDRKYEPKLSFIFEPLRSRERISILKAILDMEYDLEVFVRSGIIEDYFPMHETTEIESVKIRWTIGCCPEPFRTPDDLMNENRSSVMAGLSTIAGYYGEEKAMYFAFVSFYSLYISLYLVPLGILISAYQFYNIAIHGNFGSSEDGVYIPIFSVLVSIWATTIVEKWKRKQAELAFRWDTTDVVVEEGFRAEYWGAEKFDPVTLTVIKDFPNSERMKLRCLGYFVVVTMVCLVVVIFLLVRWFKTVFVLLQPVEQHVTWRAAAGVVQGITIAVLNVLYKAVAEALTKMENHPTQTKHDNALIFKIFLFQFINGNMALMSAAFLDREPVTLWTLLITLMIGNQFVTLFVNQLLPRLLYQYEYAMTKKAMLLKGLSGLSKVMPLPSFGSNDNDNRPKRKNTRITKAKKSILSKNDYERTIEEKKIIDEIKEANNQVQEIETELDKDAAAVGSTAFRQEGALAEALRNCSMGDDDLLIDHYAQMILQFTYVVLWSSVFPLTPVVAVIANMGQIRFEITQLCYYTKRPIPKKEEGIGAWMTIVEIISLIGVVVNSAMIIMTFKARESFQKLFETNFYSNSNNNNNNTNNNMFSNSSNVSATTFGYLQESVPPDLYLSSDLNFLWVMVAVEHCVIIFKLVLREFIEDVPRWVAEAQISEDADEKRAIEMEALLAVQEQQERMKVNERRLTRTEIELAETRRLSTASVSGAKIGAILKTNTTNLHAIQIQQRSEQHQEKTIQRIKIREKEADERVQKRLELRKHAKKTKALKRNRVFKKLKDESCEHIVDCMTYEKIAGGEVLCTEGDVANKMYLLMRGSCDVLVGSNHIANLEELSVFGESVLFVKDGGLRTATVVAENDIEVLVLNKIDMDALIKSGDLGPNCIAELENLAKARRMENNTHSKGT